MDRMDRSGESGKGGKIAVMGDHDSIFGFVALGLDIFPAENSGETAKLLHRLVENQYGIIYMTEELAAQLKGEIQRYQGQVSPVIIQILGISGNTGEGTAGVRRSVETAVGSDILFGE